MLWTIFRDSADFVVAGHGQFYTLGKFIHILLVIAVVVLLINWITGRRPAL